MKIEIPRLKPLLSEPSRELFTTAIWTDLELARMIHYYQTLADLTRIEPGIGLVNSYAKDKLYTYERIADAREWQHDTWMWTRVSHSGYVIRTTDGDLITKPNPSEEELLR